MEDFCDRIPGQHTGRLSLEHQAREAAEWQRKVDDLQKQLDSANRIIRIKDETIILHEKRCDNLREELDERADTIAVLHKTILEKNEAIRSAVKASPAAGESELRKLAPGDHSETLGTPPATPSAAVGASEPGADVASLEKDAARYRWLRSQHSSDNTVAVVVKPDKSVNIGSHCPWMLALDSLIDEAMRDSEPAESPDDWVPLTDPPQHVIRTIDECRLKFGPDRKWEQCVGLVGSRLTDHVHCYEFRCRRKDLRFVPAVTKTRTVTLREYLCGDKYWTTFGMGLQYTGRKVVVEVPE